MIPIPGQPTEPQTLPRRPVRQAPPMTRDQFFARADLVAKRIAWLHWQAPERDRHRGESLYHEWREWLLAHGDDGYSVFAPGLDDERIEVPRRWYGLIVEFGDAFAHWRSVYDPDYSRDAA